MGKRLSTGIAGLDKRLGGGLLPGTLTVVVGSSGIGKTQLGIQFADAGRLQEGRRGILFDLTSRGDSQNHADYAQRICGWTPTITELERYPDLLNFFDTHRSFGEYLGVFGYSGRRVTIRDLDAEARLEWESELARRLASSIAFFYGNFIHGVRRCVIDGVEPVDRPSESVQFELIEYVYHQILRKDSEWVARDLFREKYRVPCDGQIADLNHPESSDTPTNAVLASKYRYETSDIGCLLLQTSAETSLESLLDHPLVEGDLLSNANTIIYMGKIRDGMKFRRAIAIAKHRGSACDDEIIPYVIGESGLRLES
ncbi:MAG: ATPase domain-containing protein [Thermoguttaceae bacterium]|nr:ATPase domain-containing protein [Thermoguttaceae bacterium]